MIGRGAVQDPLVFRRVAAAFASAGVRRRAAENTNGAGGGAGGDSTGTRAFAEEAFAGEVASPSRRRKTRQQAPQRARPGEVQAGQVEAGVQVPVRGEPGLDAVLSRVLCRRRRNVTADATLERIERLVEAHWRAPEDVLVDAFSMRTRYARGMRDGGKAAQTDSRGKGDAVLRK